MGGHLAHPPRLALVVLVLLGQAFGFGLCKAPLVWWSGKRLIFLTWSPLRLGWSGLVAFLDLGAVNSVKRAYGLDVCLT